MMDESTALDDAEEAAYLETLASPTPMDPEMAAGRLLEVKRVFDEQGATFWLRSGTCLGVVREGRFIPWDDEMDTASVIGMHGLTVETVDRVIDAFRARGFAAQVLRNARYIAISLVKDGIRTDWTCYRAVNGRAYEFPGIELPLRLFDNLKEVEFIGERFLIPNPPEEYLQAKYGPDWRTPKGPGFEADVVGQISGRLHDQPEAFASCGSSAAEGSPARASASGCTTTTARSCAARRWPSSASLVRRRTLEGWPASPFRPTTTTR